jgi:hypothetical protein
MTPLDPSIVELYAEHLQRQASSRIMGHTIAVALVGAFLGSAPLLAPKRVLVPHSLGLMLLLVGAAAGGYLGYTIGVRRAEGLRLQAQMVLHQLQVEQALIQPAAAVAVAPTLPSLAVPAAAPPAAAAPVPAAAPAAPAAVAPDPAPVAPAHAQPVLPPHAPLATPVVPAVAPAPRPVETVRPAAPPLVRPAMPPLSAPPSVPEHHHASEAPAPERPVAAPPVAAAPAPPSVPRLVVALPASPPAMMPPLSAER